MFAGLRFYQRHERVGEVNNSWPWMKPGGLAGVHLPWESYVGTTDGSNKFVDLLTYQGKPFELRVREKINGKWEADIYYKDYAARPAGYVGAGILCAKCHDEPAPPGLDRVDGNFSFARLRRKL
jgi:hypothetical protein